MRVLSEGCPGRDTLLHRGRAREPGKGLKATGAEAQVILLRSRSAVLAEWNQEGHQCGRLGRREGGEKGRKGGETNLHVGITQSGGHLVDRTFEGLCGEVKEGVVGAHLAQPM